MPDVDIVGSAGVDIVPITPQFHDRLKAAVLPASDRVGEDIGRRLGDAISRNITVAIPDAVVNGGRTARVAATRQGSDTGGAFATSLRRKLEEAFKAMPKLDIRLSDTGVDAELARLRARLETLSRKHIGVDVDAAAAMAEMDAIDAELARLGEHHPNIAVRVDTAAARAQLATIREEIDSVDRDDPTIHVRADTAQAQGALFQLAIAIGGVAALPLIPVAAAGIGAIASAAVAAGAGVGALALVAVPAIKGVTAAIQAKTAADKAAATATGNSAAANVQAAQRALQMENAEQSLASAHRSAARSIEQANEQVANAERSVAQAVQNAAYQRQQAAQNVARAERSLADAQKQEQTAQQDLTEARKTAAQQLADLNDQLKDGALSQRDAALRVKEAQQELQKVMADPTSSLLEQQRAQLAYDQAVQNSKEQSKAYTQQQRDAAKARAAGVEGNKDVKKAEQDVADAQQNVRDQTQALAQAHQDAARTEVQAAQQVADAQRSLSDAVRSAADTQVQAADSIASAERGVESARLSGLNATNSATSKADAYRAALAKLTPEQRKLYDSIAGPQGLTRAFKDWSTSLQPDVLPLFTRGVNGAKGALPGLTPLVRTAADAVGILFDKASRELKSPFWRRFKGDIDAGAKPAIVGLGTAFGNVLKGMAGVVDAFLPHMNGISSTLQRITGRFAKWGANLKGSPEFENFLGYAAEKGPLLAHTMGQVAGAFTSIGEALAPISGPLLTVVGGLASALGSVASTLPWLVQLIYGVYVATKLWTIAQAAFNLVMEANPVVLIVTAIIALGAALIYAYKHVGWFHTAVDVTFKALKIAALFVWDHGLKPLFNGLWTAIKVIGNVLVWLWKNVFVPAWNGIVLVMKIAIAIIAVVLIAPLVIAFRLIGKVASWLWTNVIKPTWNLIAQLAKWLWEKYLKPFFKNIWDAIKWVGDKFKWLYDHGVKPIFDWIADKAKWLYNKGIKPAFQHIWDAIKWVGDKFKWLYDHSVGPIVDWIAGKAKWLYEKGIKPQFDKIKSALKLVSDGFKIAKDAIKEAWDDVKNITKGPVNFVIDMVYTHGIKAVWDKVAGFVGLDKLPKAPKLLEAGGTIGDGLSIARPMKTNRPTAIVGEGNPRFPEFVIPTDPKYRSRAKSLWHAAGTQLLASGGILGSAWDWTKDTVGGAISKGVDWAKKAGDLMVHPSKVWNELIKPLIDNAKKHLGVAQMGKVILKYPIKMADGLKDDIVNAVTGGGGGSSANVDVGGSGVKRWTNVVHQALKLAGQPTSYTDITLRRMNQESGGNPTAVNRWDSNWKAGYPSVGLMQVIRGTFQKYAGQFRNKGPFEYGVSVDPLANVYSSMKYALANYGSLPAAYNRAGGYDSGGWLMPGYTMTYNGTGKPEAVFTNEQWADIRAAKRAPSAPTELNADVHVYVGDTELKEIVKTEIYTRETENAMALNTGRWV
ncbi:hypothetical protein [Streptomyces griseofuscus]|uniref:Transglycosylase SLT domain-containing protein n=1 Tax=Streptomyces griseofuscus TaxID=146922 RepID=A0A426SF90_9ACTN|nr:hypothetical protein [Streptomyces griseofuscus]RRQ89703.1 hypothetical protein CQW44_03690 [Streptomyces griseofuscus]